MSPRSQREYQNNTLFVDQCTKGRKVSPRLMKDIIGQLKPSEQRRIEAEFGKNSKIRVNENKQRLSTTFGTIDGQQEQYSTVSHNQTNNNQDFNTIGHQSEVSTILVGYPHHNPQPSQFSVRSNSRSKSGPRQNNSVSTGTHKPPPKPTGKIVKNKSNSRSFSQISYRNTLAATRGSVGNQSQISHRVDERLRKQQFD